MRDAGGIAHRVGAGCYEQVTRVVFQGGDVAEGVGVAFRQVEVLRRIRRKAGDARADPVLTGGVDAGEASGQRSAGEIAAQGGIGQLSANIGRELGAEDRAEQVLGQRQLVGFVGQTQSAQLVERKRIGESGGVILEEQHPHLFDPAFLRSSPLG